MPKKLLVVFFLLAKIGFSYSQTCDLAISVEAQDLSGNDISQVTILETFQYITTISNSGNPVDNAIFSQTINPNATIVSVVGQNAVGGVSVIDNFNIDGNNIITGTIANFPMDASFEIKVVVEAPENLGGIATTVTATPPDTVTDTNPSNNTSIISIDVTDITIDFTIDYEQITPAFGTPISAWNDTATYQFTITNNSQIAYPLRSFNSIVELSSPQTYGLPIVQLTSMTCINATNGSTCYNDFNVVPTPRVIYPATEVTVFNFAINHVFEANSSITFEMTYQFLEPECTTVLGDIEIVSHLEMSLSHSNESPNESNSVTTELIEAEPCQETDVCIETVQIDPTVGTVINWNEPITFETTICNNGPLEAGIVASFRNLSDNVEWQIISIECLDASSTIPCSIININDNGQLWISDNFTMPVGEFLTIRTILEFVEPDCAISEVNGVIRTSADIQSAEVYDPFLLNNFDYDYVDLPNAQPCEIVELEVSKTQISPELPEGSSAENTTAWTPITYEITVTNTSAFDTFIVLTDFIDFPESTVTSAVLESVNCVSTTGTATCFDIEHANVGIVLDGIPDDNGNPDPDAFWEILEEDDWLLPGLSSVTFQVVVTWFPVCISGDIKASNKVTVAPTNLQPNQNEVSSFAITYFAACVDLIVQTFPEVPTVVVNQPFNWIVDITNSNTSSEAVDVQFEDTLDASFTIVGTPSCQVTSGIATCATGFNINGDSISAIIPNMEAGSTVRIFIPVEAPNFGGAFINTSEAIPSPINNEELTPETNISISSVQVIAPTLTKQFAPDEIYVGQESILTFTINNLASNPTQNNISFIDNLPSGLTIAGSTYWENSNGCTATFTGNIGDSSFQVTGLSFPEGVDTCSFSIPVTSTVAEFYTNNNSNFIDQVNIDTSQAHATLNVLADNSNVDIEILKTVTPQEVSIGETVEFTITATNLGTTEATSVIVYEQLPEDYLLISSNTSYGAYNETSFVWNMPLLHPDQSETLTLVAQVIAPNNLLNTVILQSVNEPDQDNTNNEASAEVTVDGCLTVPEVFTPNNDHFNDVFEISCIEQYSNNRLKIFNRYGVLVYEQVNYQNTWDGKPNNGLLHNSNKLLPVGTYYYILQINELTTPIIGWVYLNY